MAAAPAIWRYRGRQVCPKLPATSFERCRDVVDAAAAPERVPDRGDRPVDQAPLGIAGLVVMTRHLPDDRLDHGKAVETVILVGLSPRIVDPRAGVEHKPRRKPELDEAAPLKDRKRGREG